MSESPGRLVESSQWPTLSRILAAGIVGLILIIIMITWNITRLIALNTSTDLRTAFVLIGVVLILVALLFLCVTWLSYSGNILLYDNGFIPGNRSAKAILFKESYFIAFEGIDKIAFDIGDELENAIGFYILHKDGTISVHHRDQDPTQHKVWRSLILALKANRPSNTMVRLTVKDGDGGIGLEHLHALSANDRGRNIQYKTLKPY
jgi:hypothetical protein